MRCGSQPHKTTPMHGRQTQGLLRQWGCISQLTRCSNWHKTDHALHPSNSRSWQPLQTWQQQNICQRAINNLRIYAGMHPNHEQSLLKFTQLLNIKICKPHGFFDSVLPIFKASTIEDINIAQRPLCWSECGNVEVANNVSPPHSGHPRIPATSLNLTASCTTQL